MTKFIYLRNAKRIPTACIAYELSPTNRGELRFAYSCCMELEESSGVGDTPSKQLARKIAEGRLHKAGVPFPFEGSPVVALLKHVADGYVTPTKRFPSRMQKMAKETLSKSVFSSASP